MGGFLQKRKRQSKGVVLSDRSLSHCEFGKSAVCGWLVLFDFLRLECIDSGFRFGFAYEGDRGIRTVSV